MSVVDPFLRPFIEKCLRFIFLHPKVDVTKKLMLHIPLTLVAGFMCFCAILSPIYELQDESILSISETFSAYYQTILKLLFCTYHLKTFSNLLKIIDEDFWPLDKFNTEVENRLKDKLKKIYVIFKFFFGVSIASTISACIFYPILTGRPPMNMYEFGDLNNKYYTTLVCVLQSVSGLIACPVVVGVDGLFISFISLICIQLEMLHYAFSNLEFSYMQSRKDDEKCKKMIKAYVIHHIMILNFANELCRIYSILMLNQFGTSAISIGSAIYLLQGGKRFNYWKMIRYSLPGVFFVAQLFIYCYFGQTLKDTSTAVAQGAYNSKWYKAKITFRKDLQLVMIRSQKPIVMQAGGVYDLNLHNYVSILKASFSFYTIMKLVNEFQ